MGGAVQTGVGGKDEGKDLIPMFIEHLLNIDKVGLIFIFARKLFMYLCCIDHIKF